MRNLVIGLTFSLVSVFTILLIVISYQEGEVFIFKDTWSSLMSRISNYDFVTKDLFDKLLSNFEDISNFKAPSFRDGIIDAIGSIFKLVRDVVVALFNIVALFIAPIFDLGLLTAELIASIADGWSPLVL